MRTSIVSFIILLLFLLLLPFQSYGSNCWVTTTPVVFGVYDVFSLIPLDTVGKVSVRCNNQPKKTMSVTLSINSGSSGRFNPRQMIHQSGTDCMNYYLFVDNSRTTIWGDGTGGTTIYTDMTNRESPLNIPIYGRVPARQNVRAGAYSDSLVVTVNW